MTARLSCWVANVRASETSKTDVIHRDAVLDFAEDKTVPFACCRTCDPPHRLSEQSPLGTAPRVNLSVPQCHLPGPLTYRGSITSVTVTCLSVDLIAVVCCLQPGT